MKLVVYFIIISFLLCGCAQKEPDRTAAVKKRMDNLFEELETGQASTGVVPKTGNEAYDRANEEADKAFRELDCEISGQSMCAVPSSPEKIPVLPENTVPEKPNPNTVAEKDRPDVIAKYPLVNGKPIWFKEPGYGGYLGGVGISKPQKDGYSAQRRVALSMAQADLSRSVSVNIYNEATSERLLVDTATAFYYKEKFSTLSRQEVDEYTANFTIMDMWTDPNTKELYLWVILPR